MRLSTLHRNMSRDGDPARESEYVKATYEALRHHDRLAHLFETDANTHLPTDAAVQNRARFAALRRHGAHFEAMLLLVPPGWFLRKLERELASMGGWWAEFWFDRRSLAEETYVRPVLEHGLTPALAVGVALLGMHKLKT